MFKLIALVTLCAVMIQADPVPINCGPYPWAILKCIGAPRVIKAEIADQCSSDPSPCENNICVFKKLGWMNEEKVIDQNKVKAYFDEVAKEYPIWTDAVEAIKSECLVDNLPNLGTQTNCLPYDTTQCAMSKFMKLAKPSQWKTSDECVFPHRYVANCPICPQGCIAPFAEGTCKACKV